jgi:hypothetical protein
VRAAAQKEIQAGKLTQAQVDVICAQAASGASEILYEISARAYTGECGPVTVRPVSRPSDADTRSWPGTLSPNGWFSSWGAASSYGVAVPGVKAMYLSSEPPTIRLPYPVSQVTLVKIDGIVIAAEEYELRDHQELVRMRPAASFAPTERFGWPTSQILDLPDTEPGTFSVTFTFGNPPPASGMLAAQKLAEVLALPQLGDSTRLPQRVTQIVRQGVTSQVASVIDILSKGSLGIYEVDAFVFAVNPSKLKRNAAVWSPDIGRPRRQANPTLS